MDVLLKLIQRNIRVYVRDRASVFFSFLSVLIIIGLYVLFLGDVQLNNVESVFRGMSVPAPKGLASLINSWIVGGLLSVNAVTVALGALGTMVFDIEYKRFPDFVVAPVRRTTVVLSYLISASIISFMFNLVTLVAGELYILSGGGALLSPVNFLKVIGILALSVVAASSIMYLVSSFLKSGSAFGTLSTLLGTLIGFLTGIYIPVGALPPIMQKVVDIVPFSHSAGLFRKVFCEQPLTVFAGLPQQAVDDYVRVQGIRLYWDNTEITTAMMIAVLAGVTVVFLGLSALRLRKYKQA